MATKMSKQDQIDALVGLVDDWDIDTLIEACKENMRERLDAMSSDEVDAEYSGLFS